MKKYILSFGLIVAFAFYVVLANRPAAPSSALSGASDMQNSSGINNGSGSGVGVSGVSDSGSAGVGDSSGSGSSGAAAGGSNIYKNGTYTGPVTDAFYGPMQVEAIVSGGKLEDVKVLEYPNDQPNSIAVNGQALPLLIKEAVGSQGESVNVISGATQSSEAFAQSLAAALANAKS